MPTKTLYCIRHGYALHNKLYHTMGTEAYTTFRDTHLLEEGYEQAKNMGRVYPELGNCNLVLVSPLSRTLETSMMVYGHSNIPLICKDFLLEYPLGGTEICNRRKDVDDLKVLFDSYRITYCTSDNAFKWSDERENIDDLDIRINAMLEWLGNREEQTIAIVSHNSFLGRFIYQGVDGGNELEHCVPYKVEVTYDENNKYVDHRLV